MFISQFLDCCDFFSTWGISNFGDRDRALHPWIRPGPQKECVIHIAAVPLHINSDRHAVITTVCGSTVYFRASCIATYNRGMMHMKYVSGECPTCILLSLADLKYLTHN